MEIKYGLISSDSHGQLGKDAYTRRMSRTKWGDRVPHVVEVREEKFDFPVERWIVSGEIQRGNVCNCPTAMGNRSYTPNAGRKFHSKYTIRRTGSKPWTETASTLKSFSPTVQEARSFTAMRNSSSHACELTMTLLPNIVT
jgi:hypothetical protein